MNNRIIFCKYFKKKKEGLDYVTYPGKIGLRIYNEISMQAWKQWIKKQTILINEKKLNLQNIEDRKKIEKKMINYFFYDK
ncbi:Probable Fe(2+)-trafficking protein [Buchnera aphidicola (Thelaxes suberi)]|uniref:oxidative damage protection protein n=1 Tax=Buchnera aphidicola TaxID=9 RepID=UPI00346449D8